MGDNICANYNICRLVNAPDFKIQESNKNGYLEAYCNAGKEKWSACKRYIVKEELGFCPDFVFPDTTMTSAEVIEIEHTIIQMDDSGYMTRPAEWNEEIAQKIAEYDGIGPLTPEHWKVIEVIRKTWKEKERAPMIRTLCNETGLKLKEIYQLFPRGPARGACRIAGLPKPEGCV